MSCDICHVTNARICRPADHCGMCIDEGLDDPELVDYGKPSERSMEYLSELIQEDES